MPGVFKNGIDWLSRAGLKEIFGGLPVGLMGASPGGFGTVLSQAGWLPTLKLLGVSLYDGGTMYLSRAHTAMNEQRELADAQAIENLQRYLTGFGAFAARHRR